MTNNDTNCIEHKDDQDVQPSSIGAYLTTIIGLENICSHFASAQASKQI